MKRKRARELARHYLAEQNPTGWFEALYAESGGDAGAIPWADMEANPNLVEWLDRHLGNQMAPIGARALKVGCGLGDDAEELVAPRLRRCGVRHLADRHQLVQDALSGEHRAISDDGSLRDAGRLGRRVPPGRGVVHIAGVASRPATPCDAAHRRLRRAGRHATRHRPGA